MPQDKPRLTDSETFKRLFWPAVWLGLFLLAFATWRLYWKVQLENEKALVRAAGYPADLEELDAWYKKPAGKNAAEFWIKAEAAWVRDEALEAWLPSMGYAENAGIELYDRNGDNLGKQYPDAVLDQVRTYWASNEAAWQLMREAAASQECWWNLAPQTKMCGYHLSNQRMMVHYLSDRMQLASKDRDWPAFIEMVDMSFKMGRDAAHEPMRFAKSINASIGSSVCYAVHDALPFLPYDTTQLKSLQHRLMEKRKELAPMAEQGLRGEGAMALGEPSFHYFHGTKTRTYSKLEIGVWQLLGGEDHDRAKLGRHERQMADICLAPEDQQMALAQKLADTWDASQHVWEIGCVPYARDVFSGAIRGHLHCLMFFDAAITAIAIERHRLAHGKLPATLSALVPAYLPAIPGDAFNGGKPLQYKIEADRFTVYSFGRNQVDDGGTDATDIKPRADDITFTVLLPNAKRGIVPKRTDLPEAGK